jgi:hypothetical protein
VTRASALVSKEHIHSWFDKVGLYLIENQFQHILGDPTRVYNGDETMVFLHPETREVLAMKGARDVYEIEHACAKLNITTMFTFAADGKVVPPMIVYPYVRIPLEIQESVPADWGIGRSEKGWMTSELFTDYVENIFVPFLQNNEIQLPVIYFVDGHGSHLTYEVSECCKKNQIILICLFPNATRIMQPADVAAFKPLKTNWSKLVDDWRAKNPGCILTTKNVAPLLKEAVKIFENKSIIINGFRACGLFPFDKDGINYDKCLNTKRDTEETLVTSSVLETSDESDNRLKSKLTDIIGRDTIEKFMNVDAICENDDQRLIHQIVQELCCNNFTIDCDQMEVQQETVMQREDLEMENYNNYQHSYYDHPVNAEFSLNNITLDNHTYVVLENDDNLLIDSQLQKETNMLTNITQNSPNMNESYGNTNSSSYSAQLCSFDVIPKATPIVSVLCNFSKSFYLKLISLLSFQQQHL